MKNKIDNKKQVSRTIISSCFVEAFLDKYNPHKVWEIRKTKCGHFHLLQYVHGFLTGIERRVTKNWINTIIN